MKATDQKAVIQPKERIIPETVDRATLNLIYKAVKDNSDDSGWAYLGLVGGYINAVKPDFDTALLHKPICKGFFSDIIFK